MKTVFLLLLLFAVIGCTSSKPAPKPLEWNSGITPEHAREVLRNAEAKQPCSDQNLKNATDKQKRKCDPTRDMFDNIRPKKQGQQAPKGKFTNY